MRTLHSNLTASQQSASNFPYIKLNFTSRDRATSRVYATDDSTNRILQVQQAEGRYGSYSLAAGKPFTVSSVIRLQNSDSALSGLDFKGYRVYIEWGFKTFLNPGTVNRTSRSGPEFVISQELISDQGRSYLELFTMNLWEFANQLFINSANVLPIYWIKGAATETKVSHILMQLLGGGYLDAVIRASSGGTSFSNQTANASSVALGDVLMFPPTPVFNDAVYFGKATIFDRLSIDINQIISSGSMGITWEYSRGSGVWSTLPVLTASEGGQSTSHLNLTASVGIFIEAFDIPSDWATDTVNSQGPFYYVRARVSAVASPSGATLGSLMLGGKDFAFGLDTSTSGQGDDYLPKYTTQVGSQVGRVVEDILSYTKLGIILREDGFHASFIDIEQSTPDKIYDLEDGPHTFFAHTEGKQVVMPNHILVVSGDIGESVAEFAGVANDSTSQAEIGVLPAIRRHDEITSSADAATLAGILMSQLVRDKVQGRVEVPMEVGQELWDEVRVVDDRTGNTADGRVSQIVRLYMPGLYVMQVIMGGDIHGIEILPLDITPATMPDVNIAPPTVFTVPTAVPTRIPLTAEQLLFMPGGALSGGWVGERGFLTGLKLPETARPGRLTAQEVQIEELREMGLSDEEIGVYLLGPLGNRIFSRSSFELSMAIRSRLRRGGAVNANPYPHNWPNRIYASDFPRIPYYLIPGWLGEANIDYTGRPIR